MGENYCYRKCACMPIHNFDFFLVIVIINVSCLASGIDHCVKYGLVVSSSVAVAVFESTY